MRKTRMLTVNRRLKVEKPLAIFFGAVVLLSVPTKLFPINGAIMKAMRS
jgi:hypothetical protein